MKTIENFTFFHLKTQVKTSKFSGGLRPPDPPNFLKNITRTPTSTGGGSCVGKYGNV